MKANKAKPKVFSTLAWAAAQLHDGLAGAHTRKPKLYPAGDWRSTPVAAQHRRLAKTLGLTPGDGPIRVRVTIEVVGKGKVKR